MYLDFALFVIGKEKTNLDRCAQVGRLVLEIGDSLSRCRNVLSILNPTFDMTSASYSMAYFRISVKVRMQWF